MSTDLTPSDGEWWVAFDFEDTTGLRIFATEVEAYRHAYSSQMRVVCVRPGESIGEAQRRVNKEGRS